MGVTDLLETGDDIQAAVMKDLEEIRSQEFGKLTPPTKEAWEEFLNPIVGALVLSQLVPKAFRSPTIETFFTDSHLTTDQHEHTCMADSATTLENRALLAVNAVASLGVTCLGKIFEMHKRLAPEYKFDEVFEREYHWDGTPWTDEDRLIFTKRAGISDNMATFSDKAAFIRRYEHAEVHQWTPNLSSTWLLREVRSSLSHAHWTVVHEPRPRIRLWDVDPRGDLTEPPTFDVTIDLIDLRMLIYDTLQTFLAHARSCARVYCGKMPPSYEMLERLLAQEREWYSETGLYKFYEDDFLD